jgi:predicted Zn-dependent protease
VGTDFRTSHGEFASSRGSTPDPITPSSPVASITAKAAIVFLAVAILVAVYESWLAHSSFVRIARERLTSDLRIRAEYGDIQMPFMAGWSGDGQATLLVYLRGPQTDGVASVEMRNQNGLWQILHLEVRNWSEDHVLNLSPLSAKPRADQLHGQGRLYLVAIGSSASGEVEELAKLLRDDFNVSAEVLPAMPVQQTGYDAKRKQWIAEMLVEAMASKFPDIVSDPDARILGVIDDDMYIREYMWPLAYSYRYANRYAVVPTARLNPAFYRRKPNETIKTERLRKIALKCLGMLYFDLGESENPDSVMSFESTIRAIDEQSESYLATDLAGRAKSGSMEGTPCLNFSSANVTGLTRLEPISACWEAYDVSDKSFYQVDLTQGEFRAKRNDFYRSGPLPLFVRRENFSHSYDSKAGAFGKSSWQNLDDTVWSTDPQTIQMISISGVVFRRVTPGVGFSPSARYVAPTGSGEFSNAWLTWEDGRWKIQNGYGVVWHYMGCGPNTPVRCYFIDRTDFAGDRIAVERDSRGHIERVRQTAAGGLPDSYNHTWSFTYDGETVRRIEDSDGGWVQYQFNADKYLTAVETDGHRVQYDYDERNRMNRVIEDDRALGIHYDSEGRVDEIDFASQPAYHIRYSGETVEVSGPDGVYVISLRGSYFDVKHSSPINIPPK